MNKTKFLFFSTLLMFNFPLMSFAGNLLTEEAVIQSAKKHYPQIYSNEEKIRIAEGKQREALGAFDAELQASQKQFTSGYYRDIGYLETKIVKPLPVANAKVYGGYTKSVNGQYPEILPYYNTKSEGRSMFGAEFSLLRGFLVNEQNTTLKIAGLDVKIAKYSNSLMEKQIIADARKNYWKYFYAHKIFALYEHLLEIAVERNKAFEEQVKKGDKAAILLEENKRAILRRKSNLETAQREMRNAANNLGLYLRDSKGDMLSAETIFNQELSAKESFVQRPFHDESFIERIKQNRLDVKITEILLNQTNLRLDLAKNDLLPVVDVGFEVSQDYGVGSPMKDSMLVKANLTVSLPLEYNKQTGRIQKNKAEQARIYQELRLLKDSIRNEINLTYNRISEQEAIFNNLKEEIIILEKLLKAENIRFRNGASDFFMLNVREQDLFATQDYFYKSQLALTELLIEYQFMTKDTLLAGPSV